MPSPDLIVLIPPSEGKQSGGHFPPLKKIPSASQEILSRLKQVKSSEWEKLLGVKGKALDAAVAANRSVLTSPILPAIERYSGVVYNGLDYPSLTKKARTYVDRHVRIVSALFGLVAPDQPIPDYKLKIDKLRADKHWQPVIAKQLKGAFVIDLLPKAHQKAVVYDEGCAPAFLFMKDGRSKPAGHNGKHIKGRFLRFLAEGRIKDPADFSRFREDGFRFVDGNFVKYL